MTRLNVARMRKYAGLARPERPSEAAGGGLYCRQFGHYFTFSTKPIPGPTAEGGEV